MSQKEKVPSYADIRENKQALDDIERELLEEGPLTEEDLAVLEALRSENEQSLVDKQQIGAEILKGLAAEEQQLQKGNAWRDTGER